MLHFLILGWFELTITETWLTAVRWLRFPIVFALVLPYHLGEELLLGPTQSPAEKTPPASLRGSGQAEGGRYISLAAQRPSAASATGCCSV